MVGGGLSTIYALYYFHSGPDFNDHLTQAFLSCAETPGSTLLFNHPLRAVTTDDERLPLVAVTSALLQPDRITS